MTHLEKIQEIVSNYIPSNGEEIENRQPEHKDLNLWIDIFKELEILK